MRLHAVPLAVFALLTACTSVPDGNDFGTGAGATDATSDGGSTGGTSDGTTGGDSEGTSGGSTGSDDGPKLDVGSPDLGGGVDVCKVPADDLDAVDPCLVPPAPADSFDPETQWEWTGPNGETESLSIPLVANLTDDNGDGEIDLCDTPDVVVLAYATLGDPGHIYVLDGATGTEHYMIADALNANVTPALGDIDGDGVPEIVAALPDGTIVAYEHDGTPAWVGDAAWENGTGVSAIALADLDADGTVEIITGAFVMDHEGKTEWTVPGTDWCWAPTAADLDDDGLLEVIFGTAAYRHDGTPIWAGQESPGFPQVADLDGDGQPEILHSTFTGVTIFEHDGTKKEAGLTPTGDGGDPDAWLRPATIHDFDGDDVPEFAMSSQNHYSVFEVQPSVSVKWMGDVWDNSGIAAGTAFDFLGDGVAEAMYADETTFYVFDGETGEAVLTVPRSSRTLIEYPVVADVDNDGSAEVLVVSNEGIDPDPNAPKPPTLQVIRDAEDRWVSARRIWNQHTYHVTNVREDGTIPQNQTPNWEDLNTFRTNAQVEGGKVCVPEG